MHLFQWEVFGASGVPLLRGDYVDQMIRREGAKHPPVGGVLGLVPVVALDPECAALVDLVHAGV